MVAENNSTELSYKIMQFYSITFFLIYPLSLRRKKRTYVYISPGTFFTRESIVKIIAQRYYNVTAFHHLEFCEKCLPSTVL